jgi:hypothetical protein
MGIENVRQRLSQAEVAEVRGGSGSALRADGVRGSQGSCRGRNATYAAITPSSSSTCEAPAGVAEVSHSFTHTPAHARAHPRAREQQVDAGPLQTPQPLHVPGAVTLLKHCRCMDCRRFYKAVGGEFYCESYIGGTRIEWATGKRYCDPLPDAWHYCADYHGPQISKDVWAWPRRPHAEVAGVAGPSESAAEDNRGGNGHETGLFRSPARTQGKEA